MNSTATPRASHASRALPRNRSLLGHLLHALNQPLTGLQCSLELAGAGPRSAEQYQQTISEALDLAERLRILVEAMRELDEIQQAHAGNLESFQFDSRLRSIIDELFPVGATKNIQIHALIAESLFICADRGRLSAQLFRFLDSVLSLAQEASDLQIAAAPEANGICLTVSWRQWSLPEHSPFSRPELGLLITRAEWEQAGTEWTQVHSNGTETCTIRLPFTLSHS